MLAKLTKFEAIGYIMKFYQQDILISMCKGYLCRYGLKSCPSQGGNNIIQSVATEERSTGSWVARYLWEEMVGSLS